MTSVLLLALLLGLEEPFPALSGVVVDTSGAPVQASIHEQSPDGRLVAVTDPRGRFSIERVSTALVVLAPGFAPAKLPLAGHSAPRAELTVVLQPASIAERVTVTAGRREMRGTDAPLAASVVTAPELLSTAALSPDDVLRSTPGFTLFRRSSSRSANPTTQGVTLRGLSASGASRTLVLAAGVPLNDPFGGWVYWDRVPQAAIERIEVVRGGSSDLYGADAVGGVIQIIPFDASRSSARGSLEGGTLDTSRVSLFASARSGRFGGSLASERLETEGAPIVAEEVRGSIDTPAGVRAATVLVHVSARAADSHVFEARVQGFGERRANGTPLQDNDTNQRQASLRGSGGAYGGAWQTLVYGSTQTYDQAFSAVSANRESEMLTQLQRVPSDMVGAGIEWLRSWQAVTLLAGADGRQVHGKTTETRYVLGVPQPATTAGGRQRYAAGFGQVTVRVRPSLQALGGLRVDGWSSRNAADASQQDRTYVSGRSALTWSASPAASLRVTGYRAFRPPTLNELHRNFRVGDTLTLANDRLVAETLTGAEASWLHGATRLSWRGTVFATVLDDAVTNVTLQVTPVLTTRQRQNAARVRSRGVELEGEWRIDDRWAAVGNLTFTHARFAGGAVGLDGLDVPQVPRFQAGLSLRFVDPRWVTASMQIRAIGEQFEDDRNTLELDGTTVVDLFVGRSIGRHLQGFVAVENVLDAVVPVGKTPVLTVGWPRTVRAGVRASWP
jgi:outer membrane receptor protein involved in Fe transport